MQKIDLRQLKILTLFVPKTADLEWQMDHSFDLQELIFFHVMLAEDLRPQEDLNILR